MFIIFCHNNHEFYTETFRIEDFDHDVSIAIAYYMKLNSIKYFDFALFVDSNSNEIVFEV